MTASQIVDYTRQQATVPFPQRLTVPQMLAIISTAQCDLAMEIRKPEAIWTITTVNQANTGIIPEYRLLRFVGIKWVRLAGMLLVGTDIPSMEGAQIQLYDATAANFQSQWMAQMAASYPGGNSNQLPGGWPFPSNGMPFIVGARPNYYLRGNTVIGFTPAPNGTYPVQMGVVVMPQDLTSDQDESPFDSLFLDAISWRTIEKIHASNSQNPQQQQRANYAHGQWVEAVGRLRSQFNMANTGANLGVTPLGRGTTPGAWGPPRRTGGTSGGNPFAPVGPVNPNIGYQNGTQTGVPADGFGTTPTPTTVSFPTPYLNTPNVNVQVLGFGNAITAEVANVNGGQFQVVGVGGAPGTTCTVQWSATGQLVAV